MRLQLQSEYSKPGEQEIELPFIYPAGLHKFQLAHLFGLQTASFSVSQQHQLRVGSWFTNGGIQSRRMLIE
jgi:hypothetical protein